MRQIFKYIRFFKEHYKRHKNSYQLGMIPLDLYSIKSSVEGFPPGSNLGVNKTPSYLLFWVLMSSVSGYFNLSVTADS